MADFKIFEPILLAQEGGWCNKAADSGGETWEGISRKNYPKWSGWPIVDQIKTQEGFPASGWTTAQVHVLDASLRANSSLQALVDTFYKCVEWNTILADQINNQSIANFIADWGVNAGDTVPVKHAQQLLGVTPDGKMGPATLTALNGANGLNLFTSLQHARIDFYYAVVAAHPEDKQFMPNWLQRTNSFKYSDN